MRIAIVVKSLEIGGMEKVAVTLSDAIYDAGHESHLIYFKHKGNVLAPDKPVHMHNFALKRQMNRSGIGLLWKLFAKFLNLFLKRSYAMWIGLFTAPLFKYQLKALEKEYGAFDLIIFRGQGTFEHVWPLHDDRFVFVNENLLCGYKCSPLQKLYGRLLFQNRNVSCVAENVMVSFNALQEAAGFGTKQTVTITNPIDVDVTRQKALEYTPDFDAPYILSVGRLVPFKNIPLLVEAYAYAREHFALTLPLVIVGDGKDRKNVEEKIDQHGLRAYVTMTGKLPNPYPWMKHADLFILSSKVEGLGMVLLEAMACGTNVVATDSSSGVRTVLQEETTDFAPYLQRFLPQTIAAQFLETFVGTAPDEPHV